MKIIAHIKNDALIVEMTRDELAKLSGVGWAHQIATADGRYNDGFQIGTEVQVSDIYNRLRSQEQIKDRMNSAASSLRALADLLETIKPIADEVNK